MKVLGSGLSLFTVPNGGGNQTVHYRIAATKFQSFTSSVHNRK